MLSARTTTCYHGGMTLKQWFFNLVGAKKTPASGLDLQVERMRQAEQTQEERRTSQERDLHLATTGWKRLGLHFRIEGYHANDWIAPPVESLHPSEHLTNPRETRALLHMNLHPLACYRALGLSHVVDHWVPLVAKEGWDVLNQPLPYALKRLGHAKQWGHIEHPAFWKEVASMLATNDTTGICTQELLQHAGWAGNLVPFEALAQEHIELYSKSGQTCHPRVAQWLHNEGLWNKEQLLPSLGPWEHLFPMNGHHFLQWGERTPIPTAYVLEWMEPLLAHFPLSVEQKASLVGQAILAFGIEVWQAKLAPTCLPHLNDVDMNLVRAICGVLPHAAFSLEETAFSISLTLGQRFEPGQQDSPPSSRTRAHPHAGLLMLVDLQEPTSRAQLYRLAVMAQDIDKGLIQAPEAIALPSFD